MLGKNRVIFCANHVSLCIAVMLANSDHGRVATTIFYSPDRCDSIPYQNCVAYLIPFSRWNLFVFVMRNLFKRPDEVCVPHLKSGRMINAYARYARAVSAIDDGMDTFREKPRNINPDYFTVGSKYYTFTYPISLASWLDRFLVVGVCSVCELARSSKSVLTVDGLQFLVIESPGINLLNDKIIKNGKGLLIKHSNPNKSQSCFPDLPCVNGASIAIEETVRSYEGLLCVGESMVLIYALFCGNANLKILSTLTKEATLNLKSLNGLLKANINPVKTMHNCADSKLI